MKKSMVMLCAAYCIAVFLAVKLPDVDAVWLIIALAVLTGICLWYFREKRLLVCALALAMIVGYTHASFRNRASNFVPAQFDAHIVELEGVVLESSTGEGYHRYTVKPDKLCLRRPEGTMQAEVRANIAVMLYDVPLERAAYAYGERIRVRGMFSLPEAPANTGEYDFGMWYKTDGIYGNIKAEAQHAKSLGHAKMPWLSSTLYNLRIWCMQTFDAYIGGDAGAFLGAVLLGGGKTISPELQENIRLAGLSHVCVVSGMHVSMLYGVLIWLFSHLRLKRWMYYPLCGVILHLFAALCGGGASVQRAVLIFDFCMLAFYTRGDEDRLYTCFCVACFMLILNPLYLFSVGFLLSFACIFSIMIFAKDIEKFLVRIFKWRAICSLIAVSIASQILILPILASTFNHVALYSVLYNLLITWTITPLMVLSILFLLLAALWPLGAEGLAAVIRIAVQGIFLTVGTVRWLPWAGVSVSEPSAANIGAYYSAVFVVYFYLKKKIRYVKVGICLVCGCLILVTLGTIFNSLFLKLDFLNVGEGDCAVLQSPMGITMLIDGGGSAAYNEKNLGKEVVAPYLRRQGISKIDYAVVSHYETDHAQGVLYICETMKVECLFLPDRAAEKPKEPLQKALEDCAAKRGIEVQYLQAGDWVELEDGLCIEVVSPDSELLSHKLTENELSLAFRLHYGGVQVLFTGDMELTAERRLVRDAADIEADILKVAHHGAATSSAYPFVARVSPTYSVISAGNPYTTGHPARQTVSVLQRVGSEIYTTAENGDIRFYIRKNGVCWVR